MRKLKACVQFTLGILNALGIDDNETRFLLSSLFGSRFTNLIFLKPVRAGLVLHPHEVHSIAENKNERFSILENPLGSCATGNHC